MSEVNTREHFIIKSTQLQYLIKQNGVGDRVELAGTFCMGKCQMGVCVTVDDEFYSVSPETVGDFWNETVAPRLA